MSARRPKEAPPDVREWARWASVPDTGQALRFIVSRRWPLRIVGYEQRPGELTARDERRVFAYWSEDAQQLREAVVLASSLFMSRTSPRDAENVRARRLVRTGLAHLRQARNYARAGEHKAARMQVEMAKLAYERLRVFVMAPFARRAAKEQTAATHRNTQRGEATRAKVEEQARALLSAGREPRELAAIIARRMGMDPTAIRPHLRARAILPPARPRKKT